MKKIRALYKKCRKSNSIFISVFLRFVLIKIFQNKNFFLHHNASINGLKNIITKDTLEVGISYVGFMHKSDKTYLNIKGKLELHSNYSIGRGCRFDIAENAVVSIGKGGYTNCNTHVIIMHNLQIGDHCIISWDCQFLDEDFHKVEYENKRTSSDSIIIGDNVWIGCGAKIYKGTKIPNGCVIASNAIVRGEFYEENSIIGGNPAKVIKKGISWS